MPAVRSRASRTVLLGNLLAGGATTLGFALRQVPAAKDWLGANGIVTVSALSGLLDVDAIVISIGRIHRAGAITGELAVISLCLAALANMLTKIVIAWVVGGHAMGRMMLLGNGIAVLAGALVLVAAIA